MVLILAAMLFLATALLPSQVAPSPPLLLVTCLLFGLVWGAHHVSQRIFLWRTLRSRLLAMEGLLQACQALPLLLLLLLSSMAPTTTACLSAASLVVSFLAVFLVPSRGRGKGQRSSTMREKRREDVEEEDEERAVERISEKQVLWHGDLQGITSCNKVI